MQKNINCILMRTVAVLLILVFLSTAMVTGRYARYISSATGEDSARVARFDVTQNSTTDYEAFFSTKHLMKPGESTTLNVEIVNNSEVAVELQFAVENVHDNLPLEYIYPVNKQLPPGDTGTIPLEIHWPVDDNSTAYCGMVDLLKISMTVVQVD